MKSPFTHDVIGVGANSVDIVYRLAALPRPESLFAKAPITDASVSCGGQVTTALATCAAMGLRTSYIGTLGSDDRARLMRDELTRHGIDLSHVVVREGENPFAVILIDERSGERTVLWRRGPEMALEPSDVERGAIESARLLHVDDVDVEASVAAAGIARDRGLPVTSDVERADAGGRRVIEAVTVPILAEHVPRELTGEADLSRALAALRRPHHPMICVTLGAGGAMLLEQDRVHVEPGVPVRAIDTTGAGDVFRGAFIHALLAGRPAPDILRVANAAAALSCTRHGAMPTPSSAARTRAAES